MLAAARLYCIKPLICKEVTALGDPITLGGRGFIQLPATIMQLCHTEPLEGFDAK
jgi:hypothetical protein